jgi:GNAT superfamily N-acetyltransferase
MRLREARPEDARALAELVVTTWQAAYRGLLPDTLLDGLEVQSNEARWRERLADPAITALVCEVEGPVAGFITHGASHDDDASAAVGEVYALYVLPEHWGQGYGFALMAAALDGLRARDKAIVTLWTLRGNDRAIRFYERQGFCADGGTKLVTHRSGTLLDEVRYRRPCGAPLAKAAACASSNEAGLATGAPRRGM